jgi:hypothetical protein
MVANLILRHIYKKKSFVFSAVSSAFDADLESEEKVAKKSCEKSYKRKSEGKMKCKSFWPITSLGDFWTFFNGLKFSIKFCVL